MNVHDIELVIFDCDGVLVDSERLCVRLDSEAITAEGWDISPDEVALRFIGKTDEYMLAEIERHVKRKLGHKWLKGLHAKYLECFQAELFPVPGVFDLLDILERIDLPMCVASSGTHEKITNTLGITGLLPRFKGRIFSAVDVDTGKPAPDLFLYAAKTLGVLPARCVVIEDSPSGVTAAVAADMKVIGLETPLVSSRLLRAAGAVTVKHLDEVARIIQAPQILPPSSSI